MRNEPITLPARERARDGDVQSFAASGRAVRARADRAGGRGARAAHARGFLDAPGLPRRAGPANGVAEGSDQKMFRIPTGILPPLLKIHRGPFQHVFVA